MSDLETVRQELLERGDEMVSFRQLVERFDEVEKEFGNTPWNLKQIYNNFNILIGEKPSIGKTVSMEEDNTHYDEFGFFDPFSFREDIENDDC